jgi:threonyl-tRNA synthetase
MGRSILDLPEGRAMAGVISVRLPDGSARELAEGTTAADLAASIGSRLAKAAVIATVDGQEVDLSMPLPDGAVVSIVTAESEPGREILRHSTSHVMAQAVRRLWPGAKYAIGPVIENGFYYDFELPGGAHFSEDDLGRIEDEMRRIVKEDQPFVRSELDLSGGLDLFSDQPFKQEIIQAVGDGSDEVDAAGSVVSVYRNTDDFVDLCRGPHVPSTGKLGHFKLMRVAGAYWRGDEKREQLQRIYGTAWESEKALAAHLHQLEEAERRDHRKLGAELDLFSFPEEIGPGLAIFHPKGGTIRRLMEDYSRQRHVEAGYEFVNSPHITKSNLFETSGHLDWFADGMYPPMELDGGSAVLPQADELPVPHLGVPQPSAFLPGAAVAALRVRHGLSLREVRGTPGPDQGPGHDPR